LSKISDQRNVAKPSSPRVVTTSGSILDTPAAASVLTRRGGSSSSSSRAISTRWPNWSIPTTSVPYGSCRKAPTAQQSLPG
jgi:hypothetical protein